MVEIMVKRLIVNARPNSGSGETTISATLFCTHARARLQITPGQIREASDRLRISGTDYMTIDVVDGFGEWQPSHDGGRIAYASRSA